MRDNERADEAKSAYVYGIIDTVAQPVVRPQSATPSISPSPTSANTHSDQATIVPVTDPRMKRTSVSSETTPPSPTITKSTGLFTVIVAPPSDDAFAATPLPQPEVLSPEPQQRSGWSMRTGIVGIVLLFALIFVAARPGTISGGIAGVIVVAFIVMAITDRRRSS